jgi:mannose/cellobiose epimerase-like protein (N-acyl-D-glucosamine 2-epimerase family)
MTLPHEIIERVGGSTDRMRTWLVDAALPLWLDRGYDSDGGGFHEMLDFDANPILAAPRRLTVQARQVFVYARALLLGWGGDRGKVERAFDAMISRYRGPDGEPGFVFTLDSAGGIVNAARDLYAHAFVLLAASAYYRLTGDQQAIVLADETLAFIDEAMAAPRGGYLDRAPSPPELLRQNPHMHLFEGLLALYEATGDAAYLGRAGEIFGYVKTRFFQPETEIIAEYFDRDWSPIDGANAVWEPGHHMEWCWLLSEYQGLTGTNTTPMVDRLIAKAYRYGVFPPALIIDEARGDGFALKKGCRTWPLTEAAKAQAARLSFDPAAPDRLIAAFDWMVERHLSGIMPGLWRDHFAEDGALLTHNSPASTLYHIAMSVFVADEILNDLRTGT